MSRRQLHNEDDTRYAVFGWDPPLQKFWMDIMGDDCKPCNGDGCEECGGSGEQIVFTSHLGDPKAGFTLEEMEKVLLEHGMFHPEQVAPWSAIRTTLEADRVGNR